MALNHMGLAHLIDGRNDSTVVTTIIRYGSTSGGAPGGALGSSQRHVMHGAAAPSQLLRRRVPERGVHQTFITVGATVHLFFHDCFVDGCDASVIVASTPNNTAEKDHPVNLSLAGDGFDTVIRAKAAVDAVPRCRNRVSCADVLAMATRDAIALAGGPSYAVELGRLDGLTPRAAVVRPRPAHHAVRRQWSLQTDMIALSAGHTVGFAHCGTVVGAGHDDERQPAAKLREWIAVTMDVVTPRVFDNQYYKNLQVGMGLLASDQLLYTDPRSRPTVDEWPKSSDAFSKAFVAAITKMGRIGVKTGAQGNIRRNCAVLN
ncbi:hypothetical protein HU200_037434 [Digitaria exilis]|uniref:Peroxidase n=1 Tax=Digitaria exilis TaxID=1010633 RepID=A0A835BE91_9POAL|nr:hypothetical protein HU200_037434 [Digitaria exilis]